MSGIAYNPFRRLVPKGGDRTVNRSNYIVTTMKVDIIRIGNSRGIRIPKALLEQCGLDKEGDLEVRDGALVLSNPAKPRQGWEAAFAAGEGKRKDISSDGYVPTAFDEEEWEW
jgi:antitoxin MazE